MNRLQTYVLFIVCCLLAACYDDPWERGVVEGYVPIYSTDASLKQISFQPPRKTVNGGKLFTAGMNVLQEEIDSGLHVISYQDPARPVKTGFLRIPGFQVAAIDGDYLYANNYNDLVAIPLKALSANMTVGRVAGVWRQLDYPSGPDVNYFECVDPSKGIVIGWHKAKINNPKCRRSGEQDIYNPDAVGHNNAGLVISRGKLYLVNAESLAAYSLSSPGQPVILKSRQLLGTKVDSVFLLNNELAVLYSTRLNRHDTTSLEYTSHYRDLTDCLKLTATGDIAYAISSRKRFCGATSLYLIKSRLKKDTTASIELNRLQVGETNAFVIAGSYMYLAAEQGMVTINIAGATLERVGEVTDVAYSDIVNSGNLLFVLGKREIICYSIAASPVSPGLISKLPY
ncbi:hypothetical protein L3C95_10975 [Chitinophaga filiformis]|uniref:hypothetical protein n=1 Tax=Chitinophaga filiformis TaxID=104663 RepID=UPI001F176CB9|nr:hypothetical protein [Chitinophaga filiformis]MCF6402681.1 hypothetical protein [Chitinophaga filiformis]MCF6403401.1 hypothetical protein [Chitinophaga filiformis]